MLTKRELSVLSHLTKDGANVPVTYRELARRGDTTVANVYRVVAQLERKGFVRRHLGRWHGIEVLSGE